jgi:hypothetical protein
MLSSESEEYHGRSAHIVRMTTSTRRIKWCECGFECLHVSLVGRLGLETILPVYPLLQSQQ